jgi:hypothetical protein
MLIRLGGERVMEGDAASANNTESKRETRQAADNVGISVVLTKQGAAIRRLERDPKRGELYFHPDRRRTQNQPILERIQLNVGEVF